MVLLYIAYTMSRSGTFYYNRRVPKHAVAVYGQCIRQALSKDPDEAQAYAERLSNVLEASWCRKTNISPVDVSACVFRGTWAVISRDLGHAFHGILGSHFTIMGRLVDRFHRVSPD
ncbi:DUF6538 domain-containing protein, partial [uncultured Marivita sp.]|uniref:DUF6538 domain-containing protein n=2 Tax=Marivita TaxID=659428 RepID=UPI00344E9779